MMRKKQGQIVRRFVERRRLEVAAAAGAAASASASTAVPSSSELVGSHVPPVTAVAAVEATLVLEVARREGAAGPVSLAPRPRPRPEPEPEAPEVARSDPTGPPEAAASGVGRAEDFSSIFSISLTATLA